jgi:hypothetical protein
MGDEKNGIMRVIGGGKWWETKIKIKKMIMIGGWVAKDNDRKPSKK